jgi:hypothetical protein
MKINRLNKYILASTLIVTTLSSLKGMDRDMPSDILERDEERIMEPAIEANLPLYTLGGSRANTPMRSYTPTLEPIEEVEEEI